MLGGESVTLVVGVYCVSSWIYEVTGPRYALRCFVTHVETRSPPEFDGRTVVRPKALSQIGTLRSLFNPVEAIQ